MKKKTRIELPATGDELLDYLCLNYGIKDGAALLLAREAATAYDQARAAEAVIKKHGLIIRGERGHMKSNPANAVSRDCRNRLLSALGKLHLEL